MWQGPALAGLRGPYAQEQRRALAEQRASATEHHLELSLACGRHEEVVPEILCALEAYPYRERLHGALMLALYRSGRSADALLAYDHARQVLADEMGIDTGPALDELHAAVLAGDRTLLAVPGTARTAAVPAEVQVRSAFTALGAPAQFAGRTVRLHRSARRGLHPGRRAQRARRAPRRGHHRDGRRRQDRAGPAHRACGHGVLPRRPVVRRTAHTVRRSW